MGLLHSLRIAWANRDPKAPRWECPCCGYRGAFRTARREKADRRYARCPSCRALERHRLQFWVLREILSRPEPARGEVLHCAPDRAVGALLRTHFRRYTTADFEPGPGDLRIDLRSAPEIESGRFDLVVASHVLEHIDDDLAALQEIHRILGPGGCAVLPVPIHAPKTVEYPEPCLTEDGGHCRAPGLDYFDRYRSVFSRVELFRSSEVPDAHQTWLYEDRTGFPSALAPYRPAQPGERHEDFVPVAWKG